MNSLTSLRAGPLTARFVSRCAPGFCCARLSSATALPVASRKARCSAAKGPLGHARYQEYAHHISESGGRLLKTSEDALAVTETITGLLADRMARGSESISVAELVREAWRDAAPRDGEAHLFVHAAPSSAIVCERRATGQALHYLLREACLRAPQGATIEVRTTPSRIEIHAPAAHSTAPASPAIMLARILLETQGATLSCGWTQDVWSGRIDFELRT